MTSEPLLIPVVEPFDLRLTVGALRRLPSSRVYRLIGEEFRFLAPLRSGHHLLAVRASSGALQCESLGGPLDRTQAEEAQALVGWMLGADRDLSPVMDIMREDHVLGPLTQRLVGMKPPRFASLWEAFCQIVPFQQVSLSAALSALNRLSQALGQQYDYVGERYFGIPQPQTVLDADVAVLRQCGLSAAKIQTLHRLAERALAGELEARDFKGLSDDDAISRLTAIPGIGPWSAHVALLRGLGRLSVFPSGDAGAIRSLREVYAQSEHPDDVARERLSRLGAWRGYLYFMLLGRRLLAMEGSDA
ncbi:MAG TPA: hypothetical protein VF792_12700 [Ktedonobacterales bacterium]